MGLRILYGSRVLAAVPPCSGRLQPALTTCNQRKNGAPRRRVSAKSTRRSRPAISMGCAQRLTIPPTCRTDRCRSRWVAVSIRDLPQPAAVHPHAARHRCRSEPCRPCRVPAPDCCAILLQSAPRLPRPPGRRRDRDAAVGIGCRSESARHQRLHAAPYGGRRAQSAGTRAAARRRCRPCAAHPDRRLRDGARDGGSGGSQRDCGSADRARRFRPEAVIVLIASDSLLSVLELWWLWSGARHDRRDADHDI